MGGRVNLSRDFREFCQSLNANGVRYLIVGGYAVAAHGRPRYTKDLDVWIAADRDNAAKVMAALRDFGFGEVVLRVDDLATPGQVVQLGYPPQRIDLLTSASGVDFNECYAEKFESVVDGVPIPFIGLRDLKKNKLAAGRPIDLGDVDELQP